MSCFDRSSRSERVRSEREHIIIGSMLDDEYIIAMIA